MKTKIFGSFSIAQTRQNSNEGEFIMSKRGKTSSSNRSNEPALGQDLVPPRRHKQSRYEAVVYVAEIVKQKAAEQGIEPEHLNKQVAKLLISERKASKVMSRLAAGM